MRKNVMIVFLAFFVTAYPMDNEDEQQFFEQMNEAAESLQRSTSNAEEFESYKADLARLNLSDLIIQENTLKDFNNFYEKFNVGRFPQIKHSVTLTKEALAKVLPAIQEAKRVKKQIYFKRTVIVIGFTALCVGGYILYKKLKKPEKPKPKYTIITSNRSP